jgi:hypothetical protein
MRKLQIGFRSSPVRTLTFAAIAMLTCHVSKAAMTDFSDNTFWTPEIGGSGIQLNTVNNGSGVQVDFAAGTSGGAGYRSTFALQGDFAIQVNYTLNAWPSGNNALVGISLAPFIGSMRSDSIYTSGDAYAFEAGGLRSLPTSDQSGMLRMVRVGDTLSGYYWSAASSAWVLTGSAPGYPQDFGVFVGSWITDGYHTPGPVETSEYGLQLSETVISGTIVPAVVPEPTTCIAGALALLPFGASALRSLRRRHLA